MQRIVSIDVLRGFALIVMILCHFMIGYGDAQAVESLPYFILNHVLGDFGAAWFLLLVGMSQVLSAEKKKGLGEVNLMKKAFLRGGYIFFAGLLMAGLAWGPKEIWDWDILTLIGSATIILFFCRYLPSWLILLISAFMALLSPWLRTFVDFKAYWGGALVQVPFISDYLPGILFDPVDEYKVIWELGAILKGYFISGTFPVFPWLAYPLIGFVVGRRIVGKQIRQELPLYHLIGLVLILLGATVSYASLFRIGSSPISDYIAPLSFYPNSITLFYLQLGVALVLFALLFFYFDGRDGLTPIGGWLVNWYKRMSRFSLTVYFLHYLVISWPLWIIYFLTGHYPAQDLMGAIPALLLRLAAVALFLLGLKAWEQYEAKFSLEWMLRRFTEDVTGSKEGKT